MSQAAQTVAYTLTLCAMNAREIIQFHLVNITCYTGLEVITSDYDSLFFISLMLASNLPWLLLHSRNRQATRGVQWLERWTS